MCTHTSDVECMLAHHMYTCWCSRVCAWEANEKRKDGESESEEGGGRGNSPTPAPLIVL